MGATGMGKGALAPWKCYKVLYISSYSKTLNRPIIYASFSQFFVGFWGLRSQTPSTGVPPLNSAGGLSSLNP